MGLLSGIFGGGTQKVSSTSQPWAEIQPFLLGAAGRIGQLGDTNQLTPFVTPSDATFGAIRRMGNLGRNNEVTRNAMSGLEGFMGQNTNVGGPQLRGDLGPVQLSGDTFGMDRISDFVMSKTLPQVASMFGQGGFANSTMAQSTAADAVTNALTPFAQQQFNLDRGRMDENAYYNSQLDERMLGRNDQNAWAGTALQAQNMDRGLNRDLAGLGLAPTINAMQFGDISAIGQAGASRDAIRQQRAGLDSANAQQAANLFAGLGGLGGTSTQTQPGTPPLQAIGGLGQFGVNAALTAKLLGGAGGFGSLLSLAPGLCDRRLKRDIERTPLTFKGLALYTFRYFFDAPDVRRIGPMADEAPKRARVVLPSGYLAVDMGAL